MDCREALAGSDATLLLLSYDGATDNLAKVAYDVAGTTAAPFSLAAYANGDAMITNSNTADCGPLTCVVLPVGCTGTYPSAGRVSIDGTSGQLAMVTDVNDGYTETLCVSCTNTGTLATKNIDNFKVVQKRNCAIALANTNAVKVAD